MSLCITYSEILHSRGSEEEIKKANNERKNTILYMYFEVLVVELLKAVYPLLIQSDDRRSARKLTRVSFDGAQSQTKIQIPVATSDKRLDHRTI